VESAIFLFTRLVLAFLRVNPATIFSQPDFFVRSACYDRSSGQPRVNPGKQEGGGGARKKSKNRPVFFSRYILQPTTGMNEHLPVQHILSLKGFCARIHHPVITTPTCLARYIYMQGQANSLYGLAAAYGGAGRDGYIYTWADTS